MAAENEKTEANGEAPASDVKEPASSEEQVEAKAEEAPSPDPLAEAKAETQRFREQWMRSAADFDNFRKRTRKELEDTRKSGKEDLLKEFLPVFDNLERAIQSATRAQDVKAVSDGLQMILRQFLDTLARSGIAKVPTVGNQFDPSVHEAIQQVETDEHPPGTVVAEVQPGYSQGERLIRAAMVVVAKPKTEARGDEKKSGSEGGGGSE
jgi:molecular chaperone GrpE